MKKIKYSFLILLLISATGCKKDFFDINKNPNTPTEDAVSPELLLPGVLNQTAKKMAVDYVFLAHWMGYWARSGTYGPSNPLENYDITSSYQRTQWVNGSTAVYDPAISWYNILKDNDVLEKKAAASGLTYYVGVAKVIKSIGYMYLVDMYNNVPYSEAFKGTENLTPKYDKGQDIYNDLLNQLDEAVVIFSDPDVSNKVGEIIKDVDIMFKGERRGWLKLINTQRLKLLLRQSEVFGGTVPAAQLAKITSDGFLMAGETASVNPGYNSSEYQQNPFYAAFLKDFNGSLVDNFNRANNYVLNKLKANNDIRYQYYFSKAETPVGGLDYRGYDFGFIDPDPDQPKAANSSNVAGKGLAKSVDQDQWLFTSVESMFLQAEAIQRGWLAGDAKSAYEAAVTESFNWLEVADAGIVAAAYLAPGAAGDYNAATNKINFIILQKYLSLVGINNFEAWVDYRRLGVPTDLPLSLSPSRGGRGIPVRLLYPQEEYNFNASNVAAQGTINAQTSKVFWDR